jgi:DNA repair exonuclease SbcCD ATPase subunit
MPAREPAMRGSTPNEADVSRSTLKPGAAGDAGADPSAEARLSRIEAVQESQGRRLDDMATQSAFMENRLVEVRDQVKAVETHLEGHLEDLRGSVRAVEARMGQVEASVGQVDARMARIEGEFSGIKDHLGTISDRQTAMETRQTGMEARQAGMEAMLGDMKGKLSGFEVRLDNVVAAQEKFAAAQDKLATELTRLGTEQVRLASEVAHVASAQVSRRTFHLWAAGILVSILLGFFAMTQYVGTAKEFAALEAAKSREIAEHDRQWHQMMFKQLMDRMDALASQVEELRHLRGQFPETGTDPGATHVPPKAKAP